jgi:serine/threonine protein kinase
MCRTAVRCRAARPYFVMDCLHGKTLRKHLLEKRSLQLDEALKFMEGTLEGLAYVHERGIVHSDVKPENLFLDDAGVRLLDFGLARTSSLTSIHPFGGTPPYMAPEVLLGKAPPGPSSDIYAAGVVLYEMLTGQLPRGFLQMDFDQALQEIRDASARPLQFFRTDLPEALSQRIDEMVAFDPSARPPTARATLARLQASVGSTGSITVMPSSRPSIVETSPTRENNVILRSASRTIWGVPPPPSLFLGRDRDLCAMKERLGMGAEAKPIGILASVGPTVAALRGWAGVGKTAPRIRAGDRS